MNLRLLLSVITIMLCQFIRSKEYVWFDGKQPITYVIRESVPPVVATALEMFTDDIKEVTGLEPQKVSVNDASIRIIQLDETDKKFHKELKNSGIPLDSLASRRDAFHISVAGKSSGNQILIVGSDARGTAYGILELSRLAGVSPWIWWGDTTPEKKNKLTLPSTYRTFQYPSVEYRGIFINDEDWSLQPWSWKTFEPRGVKGMIGPRTYKEVFKFLMRMRANAIWPGMHGITTPFYFVPGAKEAADSCGIVIGTAHCEPLMRNNVGEWDKKVRGEYNYITNKESVINYWTERLKEVHMYENIYTIGMRGIHDGAMEGVKTLQEKTDALQQVIYDQRELLAEYVNPDVTKIPQQFVPYKEVLQIMENGLVVPEDITLTWCDDNYGYMTRLSNGEQQKRSGGAGVYYHLNYWGRPHDYMWLCTIQPGLIYNEMREAYDHHARRIWIVNVHDLKPAAYDLELFLDMAWNIESVSPSTINQHLKNWLCREFGEKAGEMLYPAMLEFYRLNSIRKPEFMGWSKVEESRQKYKRGLTPVIDTEFSLTEFGGELDRYLNDYESIKRTLLEAEAFIPDHRKDAFFGQVKYMVFGASAMATKLLEAQRARAIAATIPDSTQWSSNPGLLEACAKSANAFNEILRLTDYYNNEMSGGKWKHSMTYNPRNLPVFEPADLPITLKEADIRKYAATKNTQVISLEQLIPDDCIVSNAADYTNSSGKTTKIQNLGHSMNAVSLPKGESITFEFDCPREGSAILRTAVIPTQPNDTGDIRFSVSLNGEKPQVVSFREKGRTERWKRNVLRGQALKETKHKVTRGKQTLTITALDNHVLVDQWMLDFNPERKFYVLPVPPAY